MRDSAMPRSSRRLLPAGVLTFLCLGGSQGACGLPIITMNPEKGNGGDEGCVGVGCDTPDGGTSIVKGGDDGSGGTALCPDISLVLSQQFPTVGILVDQSGSMTAPFGGPESRWEVLHNALTGEQGLLKVLDGKLRFGVTLYSADQDGDAEDAPHFVPSTTCPYFFKTDFAVGGFATLDAFFASDYATPYGDTPTGDSLPLFAGKLKAVKEPGEKIIILATDGEPDTCADPQAEQGTPEERAAARQLVVDAAQAVFADGIRTFVIAIGDDISESHQQTVANAGVGLAPDGSQGNARIYRPAGQDELVADLTGIATSLQSCVFTLNGEVDPNKASLGKVAIDKVPVGYGDANGWVLKSTTEMELVGQACALIQEGSHQLTVDFPCGSVQVK